MGTNPVQISVNRHRVLGFKVQGLGPRVSGLRVFRFQGSRVSAQAPFKIRSNGARFQDSRVSGPGVWAQGLGFGALTRLPSNLG